MNLRGWRVAAGVAVGLGAGAVWQRTTPVTPPPMVDPAENARYGDFTVDTGSGPVALSSLRGRIVLVYFGYTSCPDVCPTTLSSLGAAVSGLSPDLQPRVAGVFVSVDPERDPPDRLSSYAAYFHPSFLGGTRPPAEVQAIADDWGVAFRKVGDDGSAMGYTIDHSTDAFMIDGAGRLISRIKHGTPADEIRRRLEDAITAADAR